MAKNLPFVDMVIVGSGASGGACAWKLSSSGANVVLLEQGDWFNDYPGDTPDWEIRLKNDFGGMWGNKNFVELRRLSAKGIINNKIAFSIGDIYLKQTKFTLYNCEQELSQYEPSVFKFYRDYVNYENYYQLET